MISLAQMNLKRKFLYFYTAILVLLGLGLGVIIWIVWSGNNQWLPNVLDALRQLQSEEIFLYTIGAIAVMFMLSAVGYLISLKVRQERRPLGVIYLLAVSACSPIGGAAGGLAAETSLFFSATQTLVFAFVLPLLIFMFEWLAGWSAKKAGDFFEQFNRHSMAGSLFNLARLFRPNDPDLMRQHAFAEFMAGNYAQTIPTLERLRARGETSRIVLENLEAAYRHERMWEKNIETLQLLLQGSPKNVKYLKLIAQAHERLEHWHEALEAREATLDSRNPAQIEEVARLALRAGEFEHALEHARTLRNSEGPPFRRAMEVYSEISASNPKMLDALFEMAEMHLKMENEAQAVALWERILAEDSTMAEPRRSLVDYFQRTGQLEAEESHLRFLAEQFDNVEETLLRLAENLEGQKRLPESMDILQSAMERFPADYRFAYEFSRMALAAGDVEGTETALSKAESAVGKGDVSKVGAMRRRLDSEKNKQELIRLKQVIQEDPLNPEPRLQMIDRLFRVGDLTAVRSEFDHLLNARPDLRGEVVAQLREMISNTEQNYLLQDYLADLLFLDRQFDQVFSLYEQMATRSIHKEDALIEGCRKILRAAPDFLPALRRLGTLYLQKQQWEKSVEANRRYLEHAQSSDLTIRRELFDAYCAMGKGDEAEPYAKELMANDPQNTEVRLKLADAYEENQRFEDAIRLVSECVDLAPGNTSLYRRLDVLTRKRKRQRIDELEKMLAIENNMPELNFELADLYEQFQEFDAAIAQFQKAARAESVRNLATARLGHALALRGMFDLAGESLSQVILHDSQNLEELKKLLYESGVLFEDAGLARNALELYKAIFRVDASFRDIVTRLSRFRS